MVRDNISEGMNSPQAAHEFHISSSDYTHIPEVLIEHAVIYAPKMHGTSWLCRLSSLQFILKTMQITVISSVVY